MGAQALPQAPSPGHVLTPAQDTVGRRLAQPPPSPHSRKVGVGGP